MNTAPARRRCMIGIRQKAVILVFFLLAEVSTAATMGFFRICLADGNVVPPEANPNANSGGSSALSPNGVRPAFPIVANAGFISLGRLISAGAGAGVSSGRIRVVALGRYYRFQNNHILFEGTRWTQVRAYEASLWVQQKLVDSRVSIILGGGLGPAEYVLNDRGLLYSERHRAWSGSAGVGYGPAFLLLGYSGPKKWLQAAGTPRFNAGGQVSVSLGLAFDVATLIWD